MSNKTIFIDTEAFFHKKKELLSLVNAGYQIVTNNLVIYEFIDVITHELEMAKKSQNTQRIQLLLQIRDRFPQLLINMNIDIKDFTLTPEILLNIYNLMNKYSMNVGDVFHLLTIKDHAINFILSNDGDWKRTEDLVKIFDPTK